MENPVVQVRCDDVATDGSVSEIPQPLMIEELLVEEISIDGMCGVY